jgi:two-component system sensor kinase FixL
VNVPLNDTVLRTMARRSASPLSLTRALLWVLRANRRSVTAFTVALTGAITLLDWWSRSVSLGILYLFPAILAGTIYGIRTVLALAFVLAGLRAAFETTPVHPVDGIFRFLFSAVAYAFSSLFVGALVRNHRLMIEDLSEIEQEQGMRRRAEEQLRILMAGCPAGIVTVDEKGVILAANKAFDVLCGAEGGVSVVGHSVGNYLPVLDDALRFSLATDAVRSAAQCQGIRVNGEIFRAHTWFTAHRFPEGARLAAIVVDSSEEMREREERNLRLLADNARITAGAVSHEIRNLCGAVSLIYSNLADNGSVRDDPNFQALGRLLSGLTKVANLDLHHRAAESPEQVPLQRVLDDLRILIEQEWREIGGVVGWQKPENLPVVLADPHGLVQAFLNLVQNSLRVMEGRDAPELTISVTAQDGQVTIRFQDNGPGVAAPERLFQPFQHGADVTGMGLYISRAIVRNYGGDLRYEASEKGARFAVDLQVAEEGPA